MLIYLDYSLRIVYNIIGDCMKSRHGKLIINKEGGSASSNSKTYRVTLPNSWIDELEMGSDNRDLVLSFDGSKIMIAPVETLEKFAEKRKEHNLIRLNYYNSDELCSAIVADYSTTELAVENYSDDIIHLAFGNNAAPSWSDYEAFLEERCVPRSRDGIKKYLEELGLDEYNPLEIIKKTGGRMAEDNQWIEVKEL